MEWKDVRTPDDIIDVGKKQFGNYGKYLPVAIPLLLVLIALVGTIYSVGPDAVGVVQRFGRFAFITSPGLHVKVPFGVDKVTPIKVRRVFKEEFGIRTLRAGVKTQYSPRKYLEESLMLTGDLNTLDVRWIVQFKVKDAKKLLFMTRDPVENVRDVSEVVMRRLVGDYRVDEVLTTKREELNDLAQIEMQKILDSYQTGIQSEEHEKQESAHPRDSQKQPPCGR